MLVFTADPEPGAFPYILFSGYGRTFLMNSHIPKMHPLWVLIIVPTHVRLGSSGFHNDRDPMELSVTGMKYVSRHCRQTAAPQNFSNAAVRSAAIDWGVRPSI
jgi:hypothetical protein